MTTREAYDCDPDFRNLVDEWVRERRCPLPLCDRCLELNLPNAAECARWAATEPERRVFGEGPEASRPYPSYQHTIRCWHWYYTGSSRDQFGFANEIGDKTASSKCGGFKTALDAILWLLDNWKLT